MLMRIAWRNVWRNRRRSLITLASSSFGLATLIVVFALGDGIHQQLIDNATRTSLGHLQVMARGYRDDPVLDKAVEAPSEVEEALSDLPGLEGALPRLEVYGLASSAENSVGVAVIGVDPERERRATRIANAVVEGSYLDGSRGRAGQIVIGRQLAKRLRLRLGDKLVLLAQGADGSLASALFRIQGIFKTGAQAVDLGAVFVPLPQAQEMLVAGGRVSSFLLYMDDDALTDAAAAALSQRLDPGRYEVLTWKDLDPSLLQAIQLDDASIYILLLIVFFIVALGIVNTLLMSVFERTREFGVLLALGLEPRGVVALVTLESLALGAVSVVLGTALGVALGWYFQTEGIDLTRWTEGISLANAFMEPVLYARLRWASVLKSWAAVFVITLLSGLYPALKAARLSPVESLRHS